ncbi:MAG: terminase TerL endonuclease subunit [Pseudomonadota bacterium]
MAKHPVVSYMHGVLDGSIPAGRLIHLAVERHMRDLEEGPKRGLHFDRQAAEHVLQFFSFLKHSKGEWAGKPFVLEPWQQFILWVLFGWKRADGLRRFRTAYIEVPRKNGKTTLVAGIGLYLMSADGEPGAEVYSAATKRDQAKLSWGEAVRMTKASSALRRMIKHWKASDTLAIEETASKFQPLGADDDTLDGLNVHGALVDEVHAHKTRGVVEVLETATGARRQPLQVEITTAGTDQTSICFEHHEYSRQILEGTIEADTWFAFIACLDEGDRWDDPAVWAKANPNYGVSVKPDDLARKAEKAKKLPAALNAFLRLHLDVWTQQVDRWISLELWDENAGEVDDKEGLVGRRCFGGLDLSSVSDLTAWVMVFPHEDDPDAVDVLCRFWCPEARLTDRENRYADQYQAWERQGYLTATPGNAVDYQFIKAQVLADAQQFKLVDLNVDRLFQGYQVSMELADEGLEVLGMGQGFLSMAAPMKEFERRLLAKKLCHGGNPVLRWMAGNVAVRQDPAANLKVDKATSQGKVDGIVALVMALDRAMRHQPKKKSVYEERGLETA